MKYLEGVYVISKLADPQPKQSINFHVSIFKDGYACGASSMEFESFAEAIGFCSKALGTENLFVIATADHKSTGSFHWYVGKEIESL